VTFKRLLAAYRWFTIGLALAVVPALCYIVERLYRIWQSMG
jgi:hypothetical protein